MLASFFALALALPAAGCASVIGIEDTQIEENEKELPKPGRDFRCVGTGDKQGPTGEEITIFADVRDLATGDPVGGINAWRCERRTKANCVEDVAVSDGATGLLEIPATSGFDGHVRLIGPDLAGNQRVPYHWYFSRPLYTTREQPFPMNVVTEATLVGLLYGSERTRLEDRGEVAIASADCQDQNAPGVRFAMAPSSQVLLDSDSEYWIVTDVVDGIPTFTYPEDETSEVTEQSFALGGWINVKPGSPTVIMIDGETGEELARATLLVEPGALTTIRLLPQL